MFDDMTSLAVRSALTGLQARSRGIADNIANVNTPGFLANKVQFEDALREAVASGTAPRGGTHTLSRSLEPTRENGNNVNLDREVFSSMDTGLRYQLMLRATDDEFGLLRAAMRTQ